jgi:hypothetical protein
MVMSQVKRHSANTFSLTGVLAIAGAVAMGLFWAAFDDRRLTVSSTVPVAYDGDTYEHRGILSPRTKFSAGSKMAIAHQVCSPRNMDVDIKHFIVNDFVLQFDSEDVKVKQGCHLIVQNIQLPRSLHPGKYKYRSKYTYQVNPVRGAELQSPDVPFEIDRGSPAPAPYQQGKR